MNQDQLDSLIRSVVKVIAPLLVAHGMSSLATTLTLNSTVETIGGVVATVLAFWASHKSNAPTAPTAPQPPAPAQNAPPSK